MRNKFNIGDRVKYVGPDEFKLLESCVFEIIECKIYNFDVVKYRLKDDTGNWMADEDDLELVE